MRADNYNAYFTNKKMNYTLTNLKKLSDFL